jgi:NAD(P)-dependent dehydrogenase (short-subunit alcohol dehydrogenase family)
MSKRNAVALVTGARRGIGRGIAYALADAGFDLVINDVVYDAATTETLEAILAKGRRARFVLGDIADIESHDAMLDQAWSSFGTLDVLVNNAGVQVKLRGDMLEIIPESYDRLLDTNLRGTFFLTQKVARRMVAEKRGAEAPPRAIVTISSINAVVLGPNRAEYCISKAGLSMMTQLYAERLAGDDIMCFEVRPGIIETDMTKPAKARYDKLIAEGITPVRRWGQPDDIGKTVVALAVRALPFNTGAAFHVDGGLHMKVF